MQSIDFEGILNELGDKIFVMIGAFFKYASKKKLLKIIEKNLKN